MRNGMAPLVFVCSPWKGVPPHTDREQNLRDGKLLCEFVSSLGAIPIAPHVFMGQFDRFRDEDAQRKAGLAWSQQQVLLADKMLILDPIIGGMESEFCLAVENNKPWMRIDRFILQYDITMWWKHGYCNSKQFKALGDWIRE